MVTSDPSNYRDTNVSVPVTAADRTTFKVAELRYATDAKQVFHDGKVLAKEGADSFEVFLFGYAKTARQVWFEREAIDADASTFVMQEGLIVEGVDARDGRGWFRSGKRVERTPVAGGAPPPGGA